MEAGNTTIEVAADIISNVIIEEAESIVDDLQ